jgi:hypothetical protein
MTKTLAHYIKESEQWIDSPVVGDDFGINIREECLLESHILEVSEDAIVIEADDRMIHMLESYGLLDATVVQEEIRRYGAVGSNRAQGFTVSEADRARRDGRGGDDAEEEDEDEDGLTMADRARRDGRGDDDENDLSHPQPPMGDPWDYVQDSEADFRRVLELAGVGVQEDEPIAAAQNANANDPLLGKAIDDAAVQPMEEGVMSSIDMDLRHIARTQRMDALVDAMRGEFGMETQQYLQHMMDEVEHGLEQRGQRLTDMKTKLRMLMDRIQEIYAGQDIDEAKYQGREVQLNKPTAGDVAKFKVYVKDPSTGNVKKVNFGDKTMRIKKSNPARRRSFRARHRCENPGPKTKARYWSCRKW